MVALEPPKEVSFAESTDQFRIHYRMAPVGRRARLTIVFALMRLELYMRPFGELIRVAVLEGAERVVRKTK